MLGVERVPGDEHALDVTIRTQAGTYVKEAISGENGMSEPPLAELLGVGSAECASLDVLAILDEDGDERPDEAPGTQSPFGAGIS